MQNILICDDEKDILNALEIYLKSEGYNILKANNGKEAIQIASENEVHLILMDIMMPVMDGITAMVKLREKLNIPIILLTAKSEDSDKILGLNIGADDYITKPFNPSELIARVRSNLRRYISLGSLKTSLNSQNVIVYGGLSLRDDTKEVKLDGELLNLTPKEYDIIKVFMQNPKKVFSIKDIYFHAWNEVALGNENTVAVHIRHLREKIEIDPSDPRYIKVVWGKGYKLELN